MNLFSEKSMSRDEWYKTPDHVVLRFLNNMAAGVGHQAQECRDVLELMLAHRPDLGVLDKFSMVERQLRIVSLEASRLWDLCRKLEDILSPKLTDFEVPGNVD